MMRILAVDDDPVILDLLTGCLTENDNYELTTLALHDALPIYHDHRQQGTRDDAAGL